MTADEIVNSVCYFWQEKEDLERCSSWDEIKPLLQKHYPEVLRAWENYKIATTTLSALVEHMAQNHQWEELT